jgi:hypothetical protein
VVNINDIYVLILCKSECLYPIELQKFLQNNGVPISIILDDSHPDKSFLYKNGYYNFTKITHNPTSWERSIFHIEINELTKKYEYFYFIEEDVFSPKLETFIDFILTCNKFKHDLISKGISDKDSSPGWIWWESKKDVKPFEFPIKSFNPICRLSSLLINKIIDYKNYYEKLSFHEILIASIANQFNLSILDYEKEPTLKTFIGEISVIQHKIEDMQDNKIYHPYKLCNSRYPYEGIVYQ